MGLYAYSGEPSTLAHWTQKTTPLGRAARLGGDSGARSAARGCSARTASQSGDDGTAFQLARELKGVVMLHFASLGGVLLHVISMAGGVLAGLIHIFEISDTPIATK